MEPAETKISEIAIALFDRNFNCAQSVFAAFASQFGMDEGCMLKMASPFGGGVARRGHICGAVTGGLLALGLARGAESPSDKEAAYRLGQEFMHRFESRHGSILCRVLLDFDISTDAGWQQAREKGLFNTTCPEFVRDAVEIAQDMLDK
jgi:C_GCAxxG_C_C family probable redox protein